MSVIDKLASSLGRRDEIPNQELAQEIAVSGNKAAVKELIDNLKNKSKDMQNDCIKVIYEIGERKPELISGYLNIFLDLLSSKKNRLQWGGMTAIYAIVNQTPDKVFDALSKIISASDSGSVITKDNAVGILIALCGNPKYSARVFPLLNEQLLKSLPNQLPMYAERSLPVISKNNKEMFIKTLTIRLEDFDKETKKKRVQKVIEKAHNI